MKILHVTKRFPPYIGGIETVCENIADALDEEKYEQLVLCFNDKNETIRETRKNYKIIRASVYKVIASQPLSKDYGKLMKEAIGEFKPDVIHFDYPNPYAAHYLIKYMKKFKFAGKFQLFWHMDIIKQKIIEPLFKPQIKKLIKLADQIIVTSPNYLENTSYLPKYKDKLNIKILPLRVGDSRLTLSNEAKSLAEKIKKDNEGKVVIYFFGRHVKYKGLTYLIEANQYLDKDKVEIYLCGTGPLTEQLKEQAKEYKNIHFLGRQSDDEINAYLMACDIFAFPSITRNEAFGISLAEGLYFGKPAITFTIPGSGVNFVSIKDETGLEAPNQDAKALADNINRLVNDEKLREELSNNAKKRALELFTKESFDKNVKQIYKEI